MVADGDKVWARVTWRGTDDKGFMGSPPTGRSRDIDGQRGGDEGVSIEVTDHEGRDEECYREADRTKPTGLP